MKAAENALALRPGQLAYPAVIGTGGIGTGLFFAVEGNHTLGREESRGGRYLARRDYCKLHIVSHYVRRLLGAEAFVLPIGAVGDDETGLTLRAEMAAVGLTMRFVRTVQGSRTLLSFCLIYPDGSGCNLTADDSASVHVDAAYVAAAEAQFARHAGRGIALALPEVPLDARRRLLALGAAHRFLRVASFTSAEILAGAFRPEEVDLLALNIDETAALVGLDAEQTDPDAAARALRDFVSGTGRRISFTMTAGDAGSWCWNGENLEHLTALPVTVASTAGAGDALLGGVVSGLAAGLSLADAHVLGGLAAGVAVSSPHTINPDLGRSSLWACAGQSGSELPEPVRALLAPEEG